MAISLTSVLPDRGVANDIVILKGSGFGATKGVVKFNGVKAVCGPWTDTQIQAVIPMGCSSGNCVVTHADGVTTANVPFSHQRGSTDTSAVKVPDRDHD